MEFRDYVRVIVLVIWTPIFVSGLCLFVAYMGKLAKFSWPQKGLVIVVVYSLCFVMGRDFGSRYVYPTMLVGLALLSKPYWLLLGALFPGKFGHIAAALRDDSE